MYTLSAEFGCKCFLHEHIGGKARWVWAADRITQFGVTDDNQSLLQLGWRIWFFFPASLTSRQHRQQKFHHVPEDTDHASVVFPRFPRMESHNDFFFLSLSLGLGMPTRLPTLPTHDLMGKRLELRVHRLQKFQIDSMAKYGPTSSNMKPRSCRKKQTSMAGRLPWLQMHVHASQKS